MLDASTVNESTSLPGKVPSTLCLLVFPRILLLVHAPLFYQFLCIFLSASLIVNPNDRAPRQNMLIDRAPTRTSTTFITGPVWIRPRLWLHLLHA